MNKWSFSKNKIFYGLVACLSFIMTVSAAAQDISKTLSDSLFNKYKDVSAIRYTSTRPYYILAWTGRQPDGLFIIRKLHEHAAVAMIGGELELRAIKQPIQIAPANDLWKFSSFAERETAKKNDQHQQFILSAFDIDAVLAVLKNDEGRVAIISVDLPSHSVMIKTTLKYLKEKLLGLKEIIFVDLRAEPHAEIGIIGYNRSFHGLNAVDYSIPGANGKNIVTGVKEQKMEEADLDLYKRVLASPGSSANVTNHATVISTIIGGAGNSFYDGRGIAYGCKFFPSTFSNLFADDASLLNTNKVTIQNHSYGTVIQQFYGAEAVSYDVQTWQNRNIVHVFSAGNQGIGSATEGPYMNIAGYANLTGNFKMAKNIITVGAIDNKGSIPAESSAGPLYDGRIAPQLIALGPNGTSDAAAVVTGTVAVMQQVYADSNNQALPPSSLIKAILYNRAEDIYRTGIDYKTGYGLLNSFDAIKTIQRKEYDGGSLSQGQQWTKTITVSVNAAQLTVTVAWIDSAASANNNKALINDLDLQVIQISSGTIYRPWVLSAAPNLDSLVKPPVRKRDSLNTAEQVSISLPVAGNYQIKVTGTSVISSSVPFNLAWHADTLNTFRFTSPQHTSDVNRDENPNLDIRWKTFVADSNQTGNLYISYNNGVNWQLLKTAHKIYSNYYQWPIKDTSSRAMLKMETGFGDFLSKEFIISKVNRPVVDFSCADSFQLSWNKHIYANAYKIYTLTDSPYLKHILTVSDTFIIMKRSVYPGLVYAVEPVLSNNLPAARSIAMDISLQGVKCFYKTLYYNLLDQNIIDLILELSAASYVDSIFFERVTAGGQLVQAYGGIKVNSSINHQLVTDAAAGTSYYRVRIKLKNGSILYTDIISVLISGKKYILFYPNPADRNHSVMYVLMQNLPTDSKLQLFDISGRLLRSYKEIPNNIDLKTIATGMVIYKLFSSDNRLLETGKLIVR